MTISEVYQQHIVMGRPLADVLPDGASVEWWQRFLRQYEQSKSRVAKKRNYTRTSHKPSRRTNYAAQVLARGNAMAELVARVNIPIDGSCSDSPEYLHATDEYGVA